MERLREAGRVYLKNFYVLKEAEDQVIVFLDDVLSKVHTALVEHSHELSESNRLPGFDWHLWRSATKPGEMSTNPSTPKRQDPFRQGKGDLMINYADARRNSRLNDPGSIAIFITSPVAFRTRLNQVNGAAVMSALQAAKGGGTTLDFSGPQIFWNEVPLDLDSSEASADAVIEDLAKRCSSIEAFTEVLLWKSP